MLPPSVLTCRRSISTAATSFGRIAGRCNIAVVRLSLARRLRVDARLLVASALNEKWLLLINLAALLLALIGVIVWTASGLSEASLKGMQQVER